MRNSLKGGGNTPTPFPEGSTGYCLVRALAARGIAYRYLSFDEITIPRFAQKRVLTFSIDGVRYFFADDCCLRVSDPRGVKVPGPIIDGAARNLVKQKDLVTSLLRDRGFSAPEGAAFSRDAMHEAEAFFTAFSPRLSKGVCVKPVDGKWGKQVHLGIRDLSSFRAAFAAVGEAYKRVLVEEVVPGVVYRFITVAGHVIAIRFGIPANVEGDGRHSIAELIDIKNGQRQRNPCLRRYVLHLGEQECRLLESVGLSRDSIPQPGQIVLLRPTSNRHQGADTVDATDEVHPSYIEVIEEALKCFPGLIICGADVAIEEVTAPATGDNYHVLELNCCPGFGSSHYPWRGQPREVAGAIADYLITTKRTDRRQEPAATFPDNKSGRCGYAPNLGSSDHRCNGECLRLLFLGDTYFGESYQETRAARGKENILRSRGYEAGLEPFRTILERADFAVANLEAPLTIRNDSPFAHLRPYLHRGNPDKTTDALRSANIGCVTLANNHLMDFGPAGAGDTLTVLEGASLSFIGAGRNATEASRPLVFSCSATTGGLDIKPSAAFDIVILNGFAYYQDFEELFAAYADHNRLGTHKLDRKDLATDIAAIRRKSPTALIIVIAHWRRDYKWASSRQRALAVAAVNAGCDLVLGHGSHMMQEIDIVDGRPVIHGLGNFVFNSPGRYSRLGVPPFSLMAEIAVSTSNTKSMLLKLYPIMTDNRETDYRPRYVTEQEFANVLDIQKNRSNLRDRFDEAMGKGRDDVGFFIEYALPSAGEKIDLLE